MLSALATASSPVKGGADRDGSGGAVEGFVYSERATPPEGMFFDRPKYRQRNIIARMFGWLKESALIAHHLARFGLAFRFHALLTERRRCARHCAKYPEKGGFNQRHAMVTFLNSPHNNPSNGRRYPLCIGLVSTGNQLLIFGNLAGLRSSIYWLARFPLWLPSTLDTNLDAIAFAGWWRLYGPEPIARFTLP